VRLITRDPFGHFTRVCLRERPRRITIVSPWLTDAEVRPSALSRLVAHAERLGAAIVVVSRPPRSELHQNAIDLVKATSRSRVRFNPRLHGKLYVCETGGRRGVAVIGSANGTASSAHLDEIALMVRPDHGSPLIGELASQGVRALSGARRARRRTRALQASTPHARQEARTPTDHSNADRKEAS
jgi:hypothetical protein